MATKKATYKEAITEIEEILEKIENEELDVDELTVKAIVLLAMHLLKVCSAGV